MGSFFVGLNCVTRIVNLLYDSGSKFEKSRRGKSVACIFRQPAI